MQAKTVVKLGAASLTGVLLGSAAMVAVVINDMQPRAYEPRA